jgi:hypothetical protein
MSTKRHSRTKKYKGGGPDDQAEINKILNTVQTDLKPSPGLKYAWIMFGISAGYILIKLLTNN